IRQMYEENKRDEEEVKRVTASSDRGESYYNDGKTPGNEKINNSRLAFYKEVAYRDQKTSGFLMPYPHGVVIKQGERNHYYRGENQIFDKSQPTLLRRLTQFDNDEERMLYRIIAYMRISEFKSFLSKFNIVKNWEYGDVLFEPLAQHYGLETDWLDITNDFNVALFFATCYWDSKENRWLPLRREQTERNEKTQYGVIFHARAFNVLVNLSAAYAPPHIREDLKANGILPIGFQPFMRCQSQYAYGIKMLKPFPLQDDIMFEKLYFRHSEELSQKVYELMEQGNKIYPKEGLNEFQDIIDQIRTATIFSEESFTEACAMLNIKELLHYKELLGKMGIQIVNDCHPYNLSRQRLRAMNRKYYNFSLEKNFGIKIHYRPTKRGKIS
ncbi:MAG: FRG domain-containing protein, partial [Malacoplasma sp.]|nr:FRG domain-containing protein [Malacoplasma sp.]